MANLHTSDEISSPFFPIDFADYLIKSGYQLTEVDNKSFSYAFEIPFCFCLQVVNDWIQLLVWNEQEPEQRYANWSQVHEFKGISQLDLVKFSLLLHIMDAVNIRENFRKTKTNPDPFVNFSSRLKTVAI